MAITSLGIGTGIDSDSIVRNLVAAERAPKESQLNRLEGRARSQVSAVGTLKAAVSGLKTALEQLKSSSTSVFTKRTAKSSDEATFTASATSAASKGAYNVEVQQLATAHKLTSTNFAASSTVVGTGTLTLNSGTSSINLTIDGTNNTLSGIKDAINNASGNTFVTASIVTANDGAHLILTAKNTGAANALTVTTSGGDGGLSPLVYNPGTTTNLTQQTQAKDARVIVEGFTFTGSTNTITGALDGVTLNLKAEASGSTKTLNVDNDNEAVAKAIEGFVNAYNATNAAIFTTSKYDPVTREGAALTGDVLPRAISSELRTALGTARASGDLTVLSSVGIAFKNDGNLSLDKAKLSEKLSSNFSAVTELFSNSTDGFATRLYSTVNNQLDSTSGRLAIRSTTLDNQLRDVTKQRDALDYRMEQVEKNYRNQFVRLDVLVSQMRSTGDYLTRQLANL